MVRDQPQSFHTLINVQQYRKSCSNCNLKPGSLPCCADALPNELSSEHLHSMQIRDAGGRGFKSPLRKPFQNYYTLDHMHS